MSYVIATWKDEMPHAVRACAETKEFVLVPLDSSVALNKIYSHPYRAGAQMILNWINENDDSLANENLSIQDEARFYK